MMYLDEYPVLELSVIFMTKNKHMSLNDRIIINNGLNDGLNFKAIARTIGKNCSTVSKEVRKTLFIVTSPLLAESLITIFTVFPASTIISVLLAVYSGLRFATLASSATVNVIILLKMSALVSLNLSMFATVAQIKTNVTLSKKLCFALEANKSYQSRLTDSKKGIVINAADIEILDNILDPLIKEQGQSIHYIYINHHDEIMMSEKTLYKIIDSGLLKVRNIDMPRKIRMRKRTSKPAAYKIDKK